MDRFFWSVVFYTFLRENPFRAVMDPGLSFGCRQLGLLSFFSDLFAWRPCSRPFLFLFRLGVILIFKIAVSPLLLFRPNQPVRRETFFCVVVFPSDFFGLQSSSFERQARPKTLISEHLALTWPPTRTCMGPGFAQETKTFSPLFRPGLQLEA